MHSGPLAFVRPRLALICLSLSTRPLLSHLCARKSSISALVIQRLRQLNHNPTMSNQVDFPPFALLQQTATSECFSDCLFQARNLTERSDQQLASSSPSSLPSSVQRHSQSMSPAAHAHNGSQHHRRCHGHVIDNQWIANQGVYASLWYLTTTQRYSDSKPV